jgi:hypothetical protein
MKLLKKLGLSALILSASFGMAIAGQYGQASLVTGPQDSSQINATINGVIIQQNALAPGLLYIDSTATTTSTTAETTLYTYTLPAGYLAQNGQALRVRCHALDAATANTKTLTLYFGATTITTGAVANNGGGSFLEYLVTRTGAATQVLVGTGVDGTAGTAAVVPSVATPTETLANAIVIKCTATDGTAAAGTLGKMFTVESVR